jgi:hypothetical protein
MGQSKAWRMIGTAVLVSLATTPAFARTISFKDAGPAVWILAVVGAIIVLLQLIPAAILFFTFIGTTSHAVFKGREGEKSVDLGAEFKTAPVKRTD